MRQLFLSLLLLFSFSIYANENNYIEYIDSKNKTLGCETLDKMLSEHYSEWPSSRPILASYFNHGVNFKEDFAYYKKLYDKQGKNKQFLYERVRFRDKSGNLIVNAVADHDKINAGLEVNSVVTKINNKSVSSMSDEEILQELQNNSELNFEFIDEEGNLKILSSQKKKYGLMFLDVDLTEKIISEIDSKKSEHTANINLQISYTMMPEGYEIIKEIHNKIKEETKEVPLPAGRTGFSCLYTKEGFDNLGLFNPSIKFANQINNLAEATMKEEILLSYYVPNGNLTVYKKIALKDGVFKDNFKFQSFPFDYQQLEYEIMLKNGGWANEYNTVFQPTAGAYDFLVPIEEVDINEWKHSDADYQNSIVEDFGYDHLKITFLHGIERNYSYYIFKIILPIIIILFISWSVLWIRPKEIEARLTVSIVCLLSLIAYTFIIDKDIPKLSYLTIMDYVVLVSYFFSVLPTIQTIFVHNHINKKTNTAGLEYAKRIDNIAIKAIPAAYFIILFLIFNGVITDNLHTIKSFSF